MPNWCYTSVKCTGNTEDIQDLHDRMKRLQERKEDCLELDDDILSFTTETAWYRCTEVEDLIKEKYPSIDIAFRCEEPGMAIYEKNNNVFFPEDYIVDIEDDNTYYLMECEALQTLSDFFGIDFKNMDETMILVRENNDKDHGRVWVNKYEFV